MLTRARSRGLDDSAVTAAGRVETHGARGDDGKQQEDTEVFASAAQAWSRRHSPTIGLFA